MWGVTNLQNLMSLTSSKLEELHDAILMWLINIFIITLLVGTIIVMTGFSKIKMNSTFLEQLWTLIPMVILLTIAVPSVHILSLQDTFQQVPNSSIKLTSNQWNWQSSLEDHLLDFDPVSYISSYEVPVVIRSGEIVRWLLTSNDVLHSLGIPSLGMKLDSIPGRLNSFIFKIPSKGFHLGSCYELCGSGHSAMPLSFLVS